MPTQTVQVRLPLEVFERLVFAAQADCRSMSGFCRMALEKELARHEREHEEKK